MQKAKVALILTGHMRCWMDVYPNIFKNFIEPYDTDVFISTWDTEGYWTSPENDPKGLGINENSPKLNIVDVHDVYRPIILDIRGHSPEGMVVRKIIANDMLPFCIQIRPFNIVSQFYKISSGYELLKEHVSKNNVQYDWVIRMRPDLVIHNGLPNFNVAPKDFMFTLHHPNHEGLGTGDMFFAASFEASMEFYKQLADIYTDATKIKRFCPHILTKRAIDRVTKEMMVKHVELRVDKTLQHTPNGQYKDFVIENKDNLTSR